MAQVLHVLVAVRLKCLLSSQLRSCTLLMKWMLMRDEGKEEAVPCANPFW